MVWFILATLFILRGVSYRQSTYFKRPYDKNGRPTKLLLLLLCATLVGCGRKDFSKGLPSKFRIVEIEGCHYIEYDDYSGDLSTRVYTLTHKGNCPNHRDTKLEQ